ncbi:MAG: Stp1/IreP family PP2C-type Ser/Thr phosphatase [Clostridiales bacterium]|nr:Stp1/IreP family PP2C-type Ser/Thr phosphatase [Clostridiales bacterium]
MKTWGITDTGLIRKENQDCYAVETIGDYTVAVVCDGMGGTNGGQIASRIAVKTFTEGLRHSLRKTMNSSQIQEAANICISRANEAIRAQAAADRELERMGTTLVSSIVKGNTAVVSNIGDSRAYAITAEDICQITKDHSMVESMVEKGDLTPAEARRHPSRNLITRALGPDPVAEADHFTVAIKPDEFLLLCTDGLVNTVSDQEILFEIIHSEQTDNCLNRLIKLSMDRGAPDNVTVVLLHNH